MVAFDTDFISALRRAGEATGRSGKAFKLHSGISEGEGAFLESIIRSDPTIAHTLEVGCACGFSSLHICRALRGRPGARHVIVDPLQNGKWDGVGVANLDRAGVDYYSLLEEPSEFALPRLLSGGTTRFDLVFIDGWHTFDHTMLDCFYGTRLLRVGGVLAVDDTHFPSVGRAVAFVRQYPCYEPIDASGFDVPRMTALRKVAEDRRAWNWHADF
jgi:predicted O-methyltransferase YrrM